MICVREDGHYLENEHVSFDIISILGSGLNNNYVKNSCINQEIIISRTAR